MGRWGLDGAVRPDRLEHLLAPFLLIAVLTAILIAAIESPRDRTRAAVVERERELEIGLGVFFWILVGALLLAVVLRYL